jgi:hypothetical protein
MAGRHGRVDLADRAQVPPLTAEQRNQLADLLRPVRMSTLGYSPNLDELLLGEVLLVSLLISEWSHGEVPRRQKIDNARGQRSSAARRHVAWTSPTRHTYVTKSVEVLYFPVLAVPTGTPLLPSWTVPSQHHGGLMMPTRQQSRAKDRAARLCDCAAFRPPNPLPMMPTR